RRPPTSTLFPYTTLFRSEISDAELDTLTARVVRVGNAGSGNLSITAPVDVTTNAFDLSLRTGGSVSQTASLALGNLAVQAPGGVDRKSTRLNSSHVAISY